MKQFRNSAETILIVRALLGTAALPATDRGALLPPAGSDDDPESDGRASWLSAGHDPICRPGAGAAALAGATVGTVH